MAKSGTSRHSKPVGKPVTIDLDPSQVKRVAEPTEAKPASAAKEAPPAEPVGDFAKPREAVGKEYMAAEKTEKVSSHQTDAAASVKPKPALDGRAWVSHIAAGVAGGAIALALMSALNGGNSDAPTQAQLADTSATARQALQQVKSAESQVVTLRDEIAKLANNNSLPMQDVQKLTSRLAVLEEKITSASAQATQSASQDSGSIADIQSKLAALETRIMDQSRQPAIAAAIAATALKSAIDRGGSFAAELDTYRAMAPQSTDIEALGKFAAAGVPTIADLNHQFDDVANRIVATEQNADPNASVVDQLLASAKSLVKARPVGEVSGNSIGAITARIEAALARGDLDRAIAEWETLPDAAKAVSADFATQMKARRDTNALVSRTLASALGAPASPAASSAN
ncbi:COG4223 family protein [Phyllobacterium leguminum]|uniref:Inner membrane protein n=1 Tax=Phyllobacterium leguminum TaxID=314237 RepID=A0A318T4A2_9HYPH|nr:mitofilin family membrane protein [Phyllobacterium leguminum]PYE88921.1 hypothetical protein C7477_10520 [Phyllobacterium leguminum]